MGNLLSDWKAILEVPGLICSNADLRHYPKEGTPWNSRVVAFCMRRSRRVALTRKANGCYPLASRVLRNGTLVLKTNILVRGLASSTLAASAPFSFKHSSK